MKDSCKVLVNGNAISVLGRAEQKLTSGTYSSTLCCSWANNWTGFIVKYYGKTSLYIRLHSLILDVIWLNASMSELSIHTSIESSRL